MNTKQFIKLLVVFSGSYLFAHAIMYYWGDGAGETFNETLTVLPYVIAAICALSFVMFTYVDNTAKDLTDLRNDVDRDKYVLVHERLSDLKREILSNVGVVITFVVLERIIKSVSAYLIADKVLSNSWLVGVSGTALRFSCFTVIAVASWSQLAGFSIAVEFREQIARNRK